MLAVIANDVYRPPSTAGHRAGPDGISARKLNEVSWRRLSRIVRVNVLARIADRAPNVLMNALAMAFRRGGPEGGSCNYKGELG